MAIAAVPGYLGQDFATASPGLRFGMCLPVWGVDVRTGEKLWTLQDRTHRRSGEEKAERLNGDNTKAAALRQACRLNASDKALMAALRQRQSALAGRVDDDQLLRLEALAVAPFTTGLGNEHPLENGFAFLSPYGLPYLAGSGVKGVLRAAAVELVDGLFGDHQGWTHDAIDALFGAASNQDGNGRRGALVFWDVLPVVAGDELSVEIMTPHQTHYLQGTDSPHDSGDPNPISFLTVPPGSAFDFHVQCNLPFLAASAPDLAAEGRWKALMQAALQHAFYWLGFGAKTAIGYGAMAADPEAAERRTLEEAALREAEEQARAAAAREAELAAMDPVDREIQQCLDERVDPNLGEIPALMTALRSGRWEGEVKREVAVRLRARMEAAGVWKLQSTRKNPGKDRDYQNTLQVQAWLKDP